MTTFLILCIVIYWTFSTLHTGIILGESGGLQWPERKWKRPLWPLFIVFLCTIMGLTVIIEFTADAMKKLWETFSVYTGVRIYWHLLLTKKYNNMDPERLGTVSEWAYGLPEETWRQRWKKSVAVRCCNMVNKRNNYTYTEES